MRNIPGNTDDAAIAAAITSMARSLNRKVIAEGVETEDQLSFLRSHQCDEIKGYYLSKPITADEVVREQQKIGAIHLDDYPGERSEELLPWNLGGPPVVAFLLRLRLKL